MLGVTCLFYLIALRWICTATQLNLYFTDSLDDGGTKDVFQHDCLRVASLNMVSVTYICISEPSSNFQIQKNDLFPTFNFAQLAEENITGEKLYSWSAPIDLIEHYQAYLNQLSVFNDSSMAARIFYNCTLPRFGPMCQYQFDYPSSTYLTLDDMIGEFYLNDPDQSSEMTCYDHLKCDRGPGLGCLDWSEICDGHINCLNDGIDERDCWKLEISDCQDREYRCSNGQCIPWEFFQSQNVMPDCLDGTDEYQIYADTNSRKIRSYSIFEEDITCTFTFLSSSCLIHRHLLLLKSLLSIKEENVTNDCWKAFVCILEIFDEYCEHFSALEEDIHIAEKSCPDQLSIPSVPVLFGEMYFLYRRNTSVTINEKNSWSFYLCSNTTQYIHYFEDRPKILLNNSTCYPHSTWKSEESLESWMVHFFESRYGLLHISKPFLNYSSVICDAPNMYRCVNSSKCISLYRLMDSVYDCPYSDDEHQTRPTDTALKELFRRKTLQCPGREKYFLLLRVGKFECFCRYIGDAVCPDEQFMTHIPIHNISFQKICNGFSDLPGEIIDGRNLTDETECENWPCSTAYTHCDGIWHCSDGADELNCHSEPPLNCSSNHHICLSPRTSELICLPIEKTNNGVIDCLGAVDEPKVCRRNNYAENFNKFRCRNDSLNTCIDALNICDGLNDCLHGDDEQFCPKKDLPGNWISRCGPYYFLDNPQANSIICQSLEYREKRKDKFFSLLGHVDTSRNLVTGARDVIRVPSPSIPMLDTSNFPCHRGLRLHLWLNDEKNESRRTCLCPSSYYGDRCQYQNQRLSLTLQFSSPPSSSQTPFAIIISLIDDDDDDNQRMIHSYEQITYLSIRDCYVKYNFFLVYSTRPKNETKNYSIHIDIYEKLSLGYRGSLLIPILFPFLPVYRLSTIFQIPSDKRTVTTCLNNPCSKHGKCIRYWNRSDQMSFCQCDRGWSGKYCRLPHTSLCSPDSLAIGVSSHNRSVCVCPIDRFGPRCLLIDAVCRTRNTTTCPNGGQCLPIDQHRKRSTTFSCICAKGFYGTKCRPATNRVSLSFSEEIILPSSILVHFIDVRPQWDPIVSTTFEVIPFNRGTIIIDWLQPYHIVLIEFLQKNYYLISVHKTYNKSRKIFKMINPSDHCPHVTELINETILKLPFIHRMKYYHSICQTHSPDLTCFYDDLNLCLCYEYDQRTLSNCFKFDHQMTFDCYGHNDCENGGQCFQQKGDCLDKVICACPSCFYGSRCQFTTSGFSLSLDVILGYHIQPDTKTRDQPSIIHFSLVISVVLIVLGIVNGIFCLITFQNKNVRLVGCGIYLLGSSITTLLTIVMFGLKFFILIFTQMTLIVNQRFLIFQCRSIDYILRICLYMDQWLGACIAIERAITVLFGTRFNRKLSKRTAKIVILTILIITSATNIHDPIYRRLINEENLDQKRIWCIASYSTFFRRYDNTMHLFHFIGPFIINFISTIIIIAKKSQRHANLQGHQSYKQYLKEHFRQHKHLILTPTVLVVLGIPRLILAFTSKCMRSTNDSWLYLAGYFISFIPVTLSFLIFVLPSKLYKNEFRRTISQYQTNLRRRFLSN